MKVIPGLPDHVSVSVYEMTPTPDDKLFIGEQAIRANRHSAVTLLKDDVLYYASSRGTFVYKKWVDTQCLIVGIGVQKVTAPGQLSYLDLTKQLSIYLREGLHPDEAFDIILL